MPKVISKEIRSQIIDFAKLSSQSEAARQFKVSRQFVHCIVHNKPIKRTRYKENKYKCPITGF